MSEASFAPHPRVSNPSKDTGVRASWAWAASSSEESRYALLASLPEAFAVELVRGVFIDGASDGVCAASMLCGARGMRVTSGAGLSGRR